MESLPHLTLSLELNDPAQNIDRPYRPDESRPVLGCLDSPAARQRIACAFTTLAILSLAATAYAATYFTIAPLTVLYLVPGLAIVTLASCIAAFWACQLQPSLPENNMNLRREAERELAVVPENHLEYEAIHQSHPLNIVSDTEATQLTLTVLQTQEPHIDIALVQPAATTQEGEMKETSSAVDKQSMGVSDVAELQAELEVIETSNNFLRGWIENATSSDRELLPQLTAEQADNTTLKSLASEELEQIKLMAHNEQELKILAAEVKSSPETAELTKKKERLSQLRIETLTLIKTSKRRTQHELEQQLANCSKINIEISKQINECKDRISNAVPNVRRTLKENQDKALILKQRLRSYAEQEGKLQDEQDFSSQTSQTQL